MIVQITRIFARHRMALALALCMGILYGFPFFAMRASLMSAGLPYHPMLVNVDDKYHTAAKIGEIYRTGHASADISLYENRGAPAMLPPLPHQATALLAHILGSINRAYVAAHILLAPVIFLLFYLLVLELTGSGALALSSASFMMIFPRYLAWFPLATSYYQAWFMTQLFTPQSRLYFARFDDPLLTTPVLLAALYLTLRALKRRERIVICCAGIALGLMFYVYFYYYVYLPLALGAMLIIFLVQRRFDLAKITALILGIGLTISIPYWIRFASFIALPSYRDITLRIGPEHGTRPFLYPEILFVYAQHIFTAIAAWLLLRKKYPERAGFLAGILLPVLVAYNFQIITGFNPQPDHWIKPRQIMISIAFIVIAYFIATERYSWFRHPWVRRILAMIGAFVVLFLIFKGVRTTDTLLRFSSFAIAGSALAICFGWFAVRSRIKRNWQTYGAIIGAIAIILLFYKGALIQWNNIEENTAEATLSPAEDAGLRWLAVHTEPDSVVGTPSFLSATLIKYFGHNRIFVPDGFDTVASNREILQRMYVLNALLGVTPKKFGSYFATAKTYPPQDDDHEGISFLFTDQYRAATPGSIFKNTGQQAPVWSDDMHKTVVGGYINVLTQKSIVNPWRLDYIYYGPREAVFAPDPATVIPSLDLVYNRDGIRIWRVNPQAVSRFIPAAHPPVIP